MDDGGVRGGCCSVQGDSEGLAQGMVFPEGSERESHRNIGERNNSCKNPGVACSRTVEHPGN